MKKHLANLTRHMGRAWPAPLVSRIGRMRRILTRSDLVKSVSLIRSDLLKRIPRRQRLIFLGAILLVLAPLIINGLLDLRNAKAEAPFWQNTSGGGSWLKRQRLTVTNNSGDSLANGTTIAVSINTKLLATSYKLQSDCDDLRVLYQPNSTTFTELDRFVSYPGGGSCGTSEASKVYFKLQSDLSNGSDSSFYYVYYGNSQATTPSNPDNAFDIGSADALLVCLFDGTTTCAAGETNAAPTPGAIRYSGSKSALSFDGSNDTATSSFNTFGSEGTIEGWFYFKQWTDDNDYVFDGTTSSNRWLFYRDYSDARWHLYLGGTGVSYSLDLDPYVSLNSWHFISITYRDDTNESKVYVDGTLRVTSTTAFSASQPAGITIGSKYNSTELINMLADEFRVSNVIRYTSNFTPSTAPFVRDEYTKLLYHFDENGDDPRQTGKAIDDACPDGTCNHGTITGAKYVAGLIGVDTTSEVGAALTSEVSGGNAFGGHSGIFIEEGTTNKVTNPSFEHSTYSTNWSTADGTVNYNSSADTFTANMQKRTAPGPFTTAPIIQGELNNISSLVDDTIQVPRGTQINGNFYQTIDHSQGSISFWFTPEYDSTSITNPIHFFDYSTGNYLRFRYAGGSYTFYVGGQTVNLTTAFSAGTTYNIVLRWDINNKLDGTNYASISINDSHTFGITTQPSMGVFSTPRVGNYNSDQEPVQAIFEGFTVYRRPLFDGTYGIDVGNGDEINLIYNSGTGQDPTLVTGSWDVVFALPTNQTAGTLSTTGEAWSHPHSSNLLYTSTTNTGGFMLNGTYTTDGWADEGTPTAVAALATSEKIFAGGYKTTSDAANEGISYTVATTAGNDYVVRAIANSDTTSVPRVLITRADGSTEITHLDGTTSSTRTSPNTLIFTFEAPATENMVVKLINTAASGTAYWHQIEVLSNLTDNPSFETGSGNPWIPTGWTNFNLQAGQGSQTSDVHSGSGAFTWSATSGDPTYRGIRKNFESLVSANNYYSLGIFGKESGGTNPEVATYWNQWVPHYRNTINADYAWASLNSASYKAFYSVHRVANALQDNMYIQNRNGLTDIGYVDDAYVFQLTSVSLTVAPASEANSAETSGLRVDGGDTLTQTITNLTDKSGEITFEITPRHNYSVAENFGFANPVIASIYGDANDYIKLVKVSDTVLRAEAQFNGTSVNADTSSGPTLNAGTMYIIKVSYIQGGNLSLSIDGSSVATGAIGASTAFSTTPTTIYFGSDNAGSNQYDLTVDSAAVTAATPSENTTAPYYKFGSKSAKVTATSADATNYVISIDPNSTATHTVSAYVYDATTGNVGGTVDSKVATLISEDQTSGTTFTDMGGGWWRLTYSDTSVSDAASNFGIHITEGKTIYIDGVQLEAKAYATTYADGSLTSNAGGNDTYFWDGDCDGTLDAGEDQTADQNTQCSTRIKADVRYSSTNNINFSTGTITFWAKIHNISGSSNKFFFEAACCNEPIRIYYVSNGSVLYNWGGTQGNGGSVATSVGKWVFFALTQDGATTTLYQDTSTYSTGAGTLPTSGTIYVGDRSNQDFPSDVTLSDFRIYNDDLTSAEVADLYYSGLVSHSDQYEVDAFSSNKGQNPIGIYHFDPSASSGQVAYDSSQYGNHLTVTGATFDTQSGNYPAQLTRTLKFDGTNDIASRSAGLSKNFNFGTDNFSISGWFRHPSTLTSQNTLISKYGSAGWKVYMNSSGYLCFGIDDDSSFDDDIICSNQNGNTTSYADSNWHHYEAVRDTSAIYLYIDGAKIAEDLSLTALTSLNTNTGLFIGADSDNNEFWDGFLDEITIYGYARNGGQILTDYNALSSVLSGSQISDNLTNGLVGYWKMDEAGIDTEGENITDSSGNANTGTLYGDNGSGDNGTGMDCTAAGKYGTGCNYDGTDDYVSAANSTSLQNLPNGDFSASTWFKADTLPTTTDVQNTLISKSLSGNFNWHFGFRGINGNTQLTATIDNVAISRTSSTVDAVSTGQWYNYVMTYSNTTKKILLFLNGTEVTYATQNPLTGTYGGDSSAALTIGAGASNMSFFDGIIDNARIYNRALTPSEVRQLYEWAPGPVGYWKMDEGSGSTSYDSSGNGNTATLYNTSWTAGKIGSGLYLNGSTAYATANSTVNYLNPNGGTLCAWVKTDTTSGSAAIATFGGTSNGSVVIELGRSTSSYRAAYVSATTQYAQSTTSAAAGSWQYLCNVWTDQTVKIFVNGLNENTTNITTPYSGTSNVFNIGREQTQFVTQWYWTGSLDDMKIYNYARTPAQITEDMNAGHPLRAGGTSGAGGRPGSALGHWSFDEGYGDTANNSGNGGSSLSGNLGGTGQSCPASGTVPCPTWSNSGKFGKALSFDATDDYVNLDGADSSFDTLSTGTISTWVYPSGGGNRAIFSVGQSSSSNYYLNLYVDSTNHISFTLWGSGSNQTYAAVTNSTISSSTWSYLAVVQDGTSLTIYVNAVPKTYILTATGWTGSEFINAIASQTNQAAVGVTRRTTNTNPFNGLIDEVKIYNFALTSDQVKTEFNQGAATVFGSLGTTSSNSPSFSSSDSYCPPGQGTACTSPVAEWKLNENTGQYAYDTSVNGNTGTLGSSTNPDASDPFWTMGKTGSALNFDGNTTADDLVNAGSGTTIDNIFDGGGTVSYWVYPRSAGVEANPRILTKAGGGNGWISQIQQCDSSHVDVQLRNFTAGTDSQFRVDCALYINQWNYVAITYNDDNKTNDPTFYINGVQESLDLDTNSDTDYASDANENLYIGNQSDATGTFDGLIDQVRFYDYVRTPAQIAWDYNRGAPVAYWALDECSGSTSHDTATKPDRNSTRFDGTIDPGDASGDNDTVGTCNSGITTEMWNDGTTGKRNASLGFDGTNDYVQIDGTLAPDFTGSGSISLWINLQSGVPASSYYNILSRWEISPNTARYFIDLDENEKVEFDLGGQSTTAVSNTSITQGVWTHITGVFDTDANTLKIYINGKLDFTGSNKTANPAAGIRPMVIGVFENNGSYSEYFHGQIDDVQIYNYALTAEQIKLLYNEGTVHFGP